MLLATMRRVRGISRPSTAGDIGWSRRWSGWAGKAANMPSRFVPADRGGSTFLAIGIAAVIALLVILPPEALFERRGETPTDEPVPRIVVLPFENLGSPEDEYFADGMTEEIISRLAAVSGLQVISRTSAMYYKDRQISAVAKSARSSTSATSSRGLSAGTDRARGTAVFGSHRSSSTSQTTPTCGASVTTGCWRISSRSSRTSLIR